MKSHPLVIAPGSDITAQHRADLLGGVTVLSGQAQLARSRGGETTLTPQPFVAIPFYANSNREPTTMQVWTADTVGATQPLTLAGEATPSASRTNPGDTTAALNDGIVPKSSDDESVPRHTWWDHKGTSEWAQLRFDKPQRVAGVEVYWWDERRVGRHCRVPQSWTVQYLDGAEWKPVTGASPFGTAMDAFNRVTFDAVDTTALRIVAQLQPEWSGGILEWRVLEP